MVLKKEFGGGGGGGGGGGVDGHDNKNGSSLSDVELKHLEAIEGCLSSLH